MLRGRRGRRAQAAARAATATARTTGVAARTVTVAAGNAAQTALPRSIASGARAGLRRSRRTLRPVGRLDRRVTTAIGCLPLTSADDALLALTRSANHSGLWLAERCLLYTSDAADE